jgi:hypothetical protein
MMIHKLPVPPSLKPALGLQFSLISPLNSEYYTRHCGQRLNGSMGISRGGKSSNQASAPTFWIFFWRKKKTIKIEEMKKYIKY